MEKERRSSGGLSGHSVWVVVALAAAVILLIFAVLVVTWTSRTTSGIHYEQDSVPKRMLNGRRPLHSVRMRASCSPACKAGSTTGAGYLYTPSSAPQGFRRYVMAPGTDFPYNDMDTTQVPRSRVAVSNAFWVDGSRYPHILTYDDSDYYAIYRFGVDPPFLPVAPMIEGTQAGANMPANADMVVSVGGFFLFAESGTTNAWAMHANPGAGATLSGITTQVNIDSGNIPLRSLGVLSMTLCWIRTLVTNLVYYGEWDTYPTAVSTVSTIDASTMEFTLAEDQGYDNPIQNRIFVYGDDTHCVASNNWSRSAGGVILFTLPDGVSAFSKAGDARCIFLPVWDGDSHAGNRVDIMAEPGNIMTTMGIGRTNAWTMMKDIEDTYRVLRGINRTTFAIERISSVQATSNSGSVSCLTVNGSDDRIIITSPTDSNDFIWYDHSDGSTGTEPGVANFSPFTAAIQATGAGSAAGDPEVQPLLGPIYMMPHVVGAYRAFSTRSARRTVVCNTTFILEDEFAYHDRVWFSVTEHGRSGDGGFGEAYTAEVRFKTAHGPPTIVHDKHDMVKIDKHGHVAGLRVCGNNLHDVLLTTAYPRGVNVNLGDVEILGKARGYLVRRNTTHSWRLPSLECTEDVW